MIGAILQGVGSLFNGVVGAMSEEANRNRQAEMNAANIQAQKEINMQNVRAQEAINQDNLNYAMWQTQQQWERDDNAHQREVADLKAAGLSPLASTSGSPVTSAYPYQAQAPHSDSLPEQIAYRQQAPQFDINSVIQSFLQEKELGEKVRQFDENLIRKDKELELTASNIALRSRELDIENSKVDAHLLEISNAYDLGVKQLVQAKAELNQKKEAQTFENKKFIYKTLCENNLLVANTVGKAMDKGYMRVLPITDYELYSKSYEAYGKKLENFLASKGISRIGEISANFRAGAGDKEGMTGFGFGGSYKPNSFREELLFKQFQSENPLPVFVFGYVDWSKYPSLRFN